MGFQLIHSAGLRPHSVLEMMLSKRNPQISLLKEGELFQFSQDKTWVYWLSLYQRVKWKLWGYQHHKRWRFYTNRSLGIWVWKKQSRWEAQMVPGQLWNVNQRFFKGTQSDLPLTGHFETSKENCGHLRTSADSACSCSFSYPGFRGWGHLLRPCPARCIVTA